VPIGIRRSAAAKNVSIFSHLLMPVAHNTGAIGENALAISPNQRFVAATDIAGLVHIWGIEG
jgi:hypothetical protein